MFIDQAILEVRGGDGGAGAVSFRREKYVPKGGPDGGNGGDGGSVIAAVEDGVHTLLDFRGVRHWVAGAGQRGSGASSSGLKGADVVMRLPAGTLIFNHETGELLHDLKPGDRVVVARGGRGGWGNEHFKSSTNQTPRRAEAGEPGERLQVRLELKLIADVGLIGLPNAGKSTLLAALTRATPRIADYPFTTLSPQLGIAELDSSRRIVLADIPGLIEGASRGAGLGHDFLRHVERTRILVHLLDAQPPDGSDPAANYRLVREELRSYSPALLEKREIIALNKLDLLPDEAERAAQVRALREALGPDREVVPLSGATRLGTRSLLERLWAILREEGEVSRSWR